MNSTGHTPCYSHSSSLVRGIVPLWCCCSFAVLSSLFQVERLSAGASVTLLIGVDLGDSGRKSVWSVHRGTDDDHHTADKKFEVQVRGHFTIMCSVLVAWGDL